MNWAEYLEKEKTPTQKVRMASLNWCMCAVGEQLGFPNPELDAEVCAYIVANHERLADLACYFPANVCRENFTDAKKNLAEIKEYFQTHPGLKEEILKAVKV